MAAGDGNKKWNNMVTSVWNNYVTAAYGMEAEDEARESMMQEEYRFWKTVKPKISTVGGKKGLTVTGIPKL